MNTALIKYRRLDHVLLATFTIIIFLPILTMLVSTEIPVTTSEKRALSKLPAFPTDLESVSSYPAKFNQYYDDNFGLRNHLIHLYNYMMVRLFNTSPSERVVLGKQGWLFYSSTTDGNPIRDYRKIDRFNAATLAQKASNLENKNKWLSQQGIKYLYVIAPNKSSMYPEYMNDRIHVVGKESLLDQFVEYVHKNTNVTLLDLRHDLREAKKFLPVYGKTDTHWNDYGAYIAGNTILGSIHGWFADVSPRTFSMDVFAEQWPETRDLSNMLDLSDTLRAKTIVNTDHTLPCDPPQGIKTPDITRYHGASFSIKCDAPKHHALIFRDSFTNALIPYLSTEFRRSTYVWTRPTDRAFIWFVKAARPDIVIEIHAERYLRYYPWANTSR